MCINYMQLLHVYKVYFFNTEQSLIHTYILCKKSNIALYSKNTTIRNV